MSKNKNLIIGKNSKIVRKMSSDLEGYDFISHSEVGKVQLGTYTRIFIFSWSHRSLAENIALLYSLPLSKCVFISSVAVLANQVRRQLLAYPREKAICEEIVLAHSGSVLRIGVVDSKVISQLPGYVPVTSPKYLAQVLNNFDEWQVNSTIVTAVQIKRFGESGIWVSFCQLFDSLSRALGASRVGHLVVSCCSFVIGSPYRFYTKDMLEHFSGKIQIGFGVLGASHYKQTIDKPRVIVSHLPNCALLHNGFRNTLVGYRKSGLAALWHGAYDYPIENNTYGKKVPIFVKRPKIPTCAIQAHVLSVRNISPNFFSVAIMSKVGQVRELFCNELILAAGPLENRRLLDSISNSKPSNSCFYSDHLILRVGSLPLAQAVALGLLSRRGKFLARGRMFRIRDENSDMLVEARPQRAGDDPVNAVSSDSLYRSRTSTIVYKLLRSKSPRLFNQAFFNKFGLGWPTERIDLYAQVLVEDVVRGSIGQGLYRETAKETAAVLAAVKACKQFFGDAMVPLGNLTEYSEAQHIFQSFDVYEDQSLFEILNDERLTVVGSPTTSKIGSRYHTHILRCLDQQ